MRDNSVTPDGRKILTREPALGRPPNPVYEGPDVPIRYVNKLLLEDETEIYECDYCGHTFTSVRKTVGHQPSHNGKIRESGYPLDTIKAVIRAVKSHGTAKSRCILAAADLNNSAVKTLNGDPWTAPCVSKLHRKYRDRVQVRVSRHPKSNEVVALESSGTKTVSEPTVIRMRGGSVINRRSSSRPDVPMRLDVLRQQLASLARALSVISDDLGTLIHEVNVDPEVIEKAAKYDQLRGIFT